MNRTTEANPKRGCLAPNFDQKFLLRQRAGRRFDKMFSFITVESGVTVRTHRSVNLLSSLKINQIHLGVQN